MPKELKYGTVLNAWEQLNASLEANAKDFPHLEESRQQLMSMLAQARELAAQQAVHAASKQESSKRLQALLVDGKAMAAFLRTGIRQRYGKRAEKLVEFNLSPFRGRRRKPVLPEAPKPAVSTNAE